MGGDLAAIGQRAHAIKHHRAGIIVVVQDTDLMPLAQELKQGVTANIAGTTGNKNAHIDPFCRIRLCFRV